MQSHDRCIGNILGISSLDQEDQNTDSSHTSKKLFSLIKILDRTPKVWPHSGILLPACPLRMTRKKQTLQTSSVKRPLQRKRHSLYANSTKSTNDGLDNGKLEQLSVPTDIHDKLPVMAIISISANGITKLLQNLNAHKAPGPDSMKPVVLKNLCNEIAPFLAVLFQKSQDRSENIGPAHVPLPSSKRGRRLTPLITVL